MATQKAQLVTHRLYFDDPYLTEFQASITERTCVGNHPAVVLNQTAFYATSGGQPHDTGRIIGIEVLDVTVQPDGRIAHVLAAEVQQDRVQGQVDWARRFDHMQQHTGQHLLSAAGWHLWQAETVGFHLGAHSSSIDLNIDQVTADKADAAELWVNRAIWENRPVQVEMLNPAQAAKLPLRKPPPVEEAVRIVEIKGLDLTACGGTHLRKTGELGMVKITRLENRPKGIRLEFLCGLRTLADYQLKHRTITQLANSLTVGYWEVAAATDRLRQELKAARGALAAAESGLLEYQAQDLIRQAETAGDLRVVRQVYVDRDRQELNWLARRLTAEPSMVALLGTGGVKSHILLARSQDVDCDMLPLLTSALQLLGSTTGGGRPEWAQGGGPTADSRRVQQALDHVLQLLLDHQN
jgi:alanyl-tRNA synthetase